MNPQMYMETQLETSTELALNETDMLAGWGFDAQEIASLLWLRQWYQTVGSDRAPPGVSQDAGQERRVGSVGNAE
jgi:hypothetical protein